VLSGRSEEELGVHGGTLWCDAVAFERACEAGRPAEALLLYRGDFLNGFFVSGASPEFDYWIEANRTRLRNLAVEAARTIAERSEAEGDEAAAIRWARRAFELSPDGEHTLRRLITCSTDSASGRRPSISTKPSSSACHRARARAVSRKHNS